MARVFWWLVLGLLGWALWRSARKPPQTGATGQDLQLRRQSEAADPPQAMLACACCGVHLPSGETLTDAAGRPYCSAAHRDAGPRSSR